MGRLDDVSRPSDTHCQFPEAGAQAPVVSMVLSQRPPLLEKVCNLGAVTVLHCCTPISYLSHPS